MFGQRKQRPVLRLVPSTASRPEIQPRLDDDRILSGLRRGDPSVADAFYWRVRPVVGRTLGRLLGPLDDDADDLAQNILVHVIEAIPRYRGECPLDAWVSTVAANVVYNHIRRRRLERSLFLASLSADEMGLDWDDGSPPVSHTVEARMLAARIGEHLAAMKPDRAWAYLLHDVSGYSLDEIAHITGISTAAAQSRLSRGRRDLQLRISGDPALADLLSKKEWGHG
jgi:RNA polymerase sigma-70 factor, ECF subfamily